MTSKYLKRRSATPACLIGVGAAAAARRAQGACISALRTAGPGAASWFHPTLRRSWEYAWLGVADTNADAAPADTSRSSMGHDDISRAPGPHPAARLPSALTGRRKRGRPAPFSRSPARTPAPRRRAWRSHSWAPASQPAGAANQEEQGERDITVVAQQHSAGVREGPEGQRAACCEHAGKPTKGKGGKAKREFRSKIRGHACFCMKA